MTEDHKQVAPLQSSLPAEIEQKFEAGRVAGRKCAELGIGVCTPDAAAKGGHIAGRKTKEKGTGVFGMTPQQHIEAGRKGGRISMHNHYHIACGVSNPNCELCRAAQR